MQKRIASYENRYYQVYNNGSGRDGYIGFGTGVLCRNPNYSKLSYSKPPSFFLSTGNQKGLNSSKLPIHARPPSKFKVNYDGRQSYIMLLNKLQ